MQWKFWRKKKGSGTDETVESTLVKPREIPERIGFHLVSQLKEDPDWTWSLKAVLRPHPEHSGVFGVRLFDPADAAARGVLVIDATILDRHPELVIYEGEFDKRIGAVTLVRRMPSAA